MKNLCTLTISQMRSLLRSRKVSWRELVQAHLDRIAAVNRVVNAVVELRAEAALAEAAAVDANPKGRDALPLDGIPVNIKDHFDVEGYASHRRREDDGATRIAPRRGRAAARCGSDHHRKCNQPDFQIRWNTVSDLYGATRNPRDLSLTSWRILGRRRRRSCRRNGAARSWRRLWRLHPGPWREPLYPFFHGTALNRRPVQKMTEVNRRGGLARNWGKNADIVPSIGRWTRRPWNCSTKCAT